MNIQCNLNNQFDFDIEPQLTARVEPDTVNKANISPKQNYIIKRSPLVLYMKNQTLMKFLHIVILITFINHTG